MQGLQPKACKIDMLPLGAFPAAQRYFTKSMRTRPEHIKNPQHPDDDTIFKQSVKTNVNNK